MRKKYHIQLMFILLCLSGTYLMAQEEEDYYIVTLQLGEETPNRKQSSFILGKVEIISRTDSAVTFKIFNRNSYYLINSLQFGLDKSVINLSIIEAEGEMKWVFIDFEHPDDYTPPLVAENRVIPIRPVMDRSKRIIPKRENASDIGFGMGISYRMHRYDNEVMWYFKRVSTFSLDLELLIGDWTVTGNMAWGGGYLYDSLNALGWEWEPFTKVATSAKGIFLSHASVVKDYGKFSPFIGMQRIDIKLKPQFYMLTPVGFENIITSPNSFTIGLHYELLSQGGIFNGKLHTESGLRVSYSYTFLGFENIRGYMHQLTIGLALKFRQANVK